MSEHNYNYIQISRNTQLSNNVGKYPVSKSDFTPQTMSIFDKYNKNNDNILDEHELNQLYTDLKSVEGEKNIVKAFLNKFFPDTKIDKKQVETQFNNIQQNYTNQISSNADGVIDESKQGHTGDCWLLSQVNALSKTEWGAEAIKESITKDGENYTVNFKGVDYTTVITPEEIEKARQSGKYSSGDLDMMLLEMATGRYFIENGISDTKDENLAIKGNTPSGQTSMQYLLTGNEGISLYFERGEESQYAIENVENSEQTQNKNDSNMGVEKGGYISSSDQVKEILKNIVENPGKYQITTIFRPKQEWDNKYSGVKKFDAVNDHLFSISDKDIVVDKNGEIVGINIYNSWDTKIKIYKPIDEYIDQMGGIAITCQGDNYDDIIEAVNNKLEEDQT